MAENETAAVAGAPAELPILNAETHAVAHDNARTRANQGAFLAAYAKTCRIDRAAEAAGIGRRTHYDWLERDAQYRALFREAREVAHQVLEDEAVSRAVDGWDEPVFHDGVECGRVRKRSDRLLELLLRAKRPNEYRERYTMEHTGSGGQPLVPAEVWDALLKAAADADGDGTKV